MDPVNNPYEHQRKDHEMAKEPGHKLSGSTSDRIRSGDIPADALSKGRDLGEAPPSDAAVRSAQGHGLGSGATTARNGGAS